VPSFFKDYVIKTQTKLRSPNIFQHFSMALKEAKVEIISDSMQVEEVSNYITTCHVKGVNTDVCVIKSLTKMATVWLRIIRNCCENKVNVAEYMSIHPYVQVHKYTSIYTGT
jgi:O-acetylhomoserine/O-acetylserine sulfhydrylase-like pyridoxal-dependent enzyme